MTQRKMKSSTNLLIQFCCQKGVRNISDVILDHPSESMAVVVLILVQGGGGWISCQGLLEPMKLSRAGLYHTRQDVREDAVSHRNGWQHGGRAPPPPVRGLQSLESSVEDGLAPPF